MAKIKGHWLDELFGPDIVISANGTLLTARDIIEFDGSFEVTDEGDRIRIELASDGGELDGDVVGDTDDNAVHSLSGDSDSLVTVYADTIKWDAGASEGEAELSISGGELDGGALQARHNDKRVLLFTSSGAVVGNSTAIQQMVGGHRFTTRTIGSNVTLDTTTTDTIGWIDASVERQVTAPPASAGRVVLLPFVGGTSPVFKRRASELINGVASNYTLEGDAAGGLGIAISDGTNWIARSIFTPEEGGAEEAAIVFSPVDTLRDNNTDAPADTGGNQTSGTAFFVRSGSSVDITGIRFYWAGTANQVIKTVLYSAAGAVLKTANVTTAGAGVYTSVFASPQTAQTGIQYKAAVYDTTGAGQKYTKVSNSSLTAGLVPARPFFGGRRIGWINLGLWLAGDNNPTSTAGGEWYLVEPVLSE